MATAKDIMDKKLLAAKEAKPVAPAPEPKPTIEVPAEATSALRTPNVEWKPAERTNSYVSRAPNTEIFLGDKTSFKFNGNYYTTSNSKEIFELDSLCRRSPNVFSKSA
jgi:hypothetical protein